MGARDQRDDAASGVERPYPTELALDERSWVAPNAVLVGRVSLARDASVWYGCVLRGDLEPIEIGEESNIQDLTVCHVDEGYPVRIGRRVTVGHRSVVHGAAIDDEAVIGMGAVLLSGSRVGRGALVAAGAVVLEGFDVPAGAIAGGVPARLIGEVGDDLRRRFAAGTDTYVAGARAYRQRRAGGGPHGGSGR